MLVWVERRGAGLIQDRPGPNRVGPFGLLQPRSPTSVKFFFKEDVIPSSADKMLYVLAPAIAVFSALTTFAVIPYGAALPVGGRDIPLIGADISIGVLYIFALTSLSVYGIVLAGWASNNKFSLIGGIRSSAQIISYELAMTTAAAGVILSAGSLPAADIVASQGRLARVHSALERRPAVRRVPRLLHRRRSPRPTGPLRPAGGGRGARRPGTTPSTRR